jgi:hypothetical protein
VNDAGRAASSRSWIALWFAACCLAPVAARANCGAEGCPLVREGLGAASSRFAVDLRYQDVTQDKLWSGNSETSLADAIAASDVHGEVELFTHTRSWVGEARAQLTDWLRLTATLPYIDREHRHWLKHTAAYNPAFLDTWKFRGLADATLLAHVKTFMTAGGTMLTLQGGVKLPTGRRHLPDETQTKFGFDSTLEPSARPGSGSTDWLTGGLLTQRLPWKGALPLSGSLLMRFNTKGTDGFKAGDELQAGLSAGYAPMDRLTLIAQVNYSGHGSDASSDPSEIAHTGMKALYVTPGLTVRVSPALAIYGLYQLRAWGRSDEATVVATNHFLFGTTFSIGR